MRTDSDSLERALRDARRELERLTPYSREWLAVRDLAEMLKLRRAQLHGLIEV
jgi:hypothetical protein